MDAQQKLQHVYPLVSNRRGTRYAERRRQKEEDRANGYSAPKYIIYPQIDTAVMVDVEYPHSSTIRIIVSMNAIFLSLINRN